MRILIDLQGAQSESRFRGIGRYSLALALGVARNAGDHEIWLLLNGGLPASLADLRTAFAGLVPPERIHVFDIAAPTAEIDPANCVRCRASELVREYFIEQLAPDAVLVTSLFEGYIDDTVVSAGRFAGAAHTAVVLYDLIPFLNPSGYLGTPMQRDHYAGKIASLKRAGLLLAISDYTRQEAIGALGLDPDNVVAISTAADASFTPAAAPVDLAPLHQRLGIVRPTILYAPGGFDSRKNLDGLIIAYSLLAPDVRARHQLVIASRLGSNDAEAMRKLAARHGLRPDELVLTGYVSDDDLIALYRSTALFVFPSKHEGFGLPALEAMSCGAIVIGGDNTSIPEVIGCSEALFDAASPPSIAAKISEVLSQPDVRERLREHGRSQVTKFSWDASARKALRALEAHAARATAAPAVQRPDRAALFHALAEVDGLAANLPTQSDIAVALARIPASFDQRQLLVDISDVDPAHPPPGLQEILRALIAHSGDALRVEPVFLASNGSTLRYARTLTTTLLTPDQPAASTDAVIDWAPGDVLLDPWPDMHAAADSQARTALHAFLRGRGVRVESSASLTTRPVADLLALCIRTR